MFVYCRKRLYVYSMRTMTQLEIFRNQIADLFTEDQKIYYLPEYKFRTEILFLVLILVLVDDGFGVIVRLIIELR